MNRLYLGSDAEMTRFGERLGRAVSAAGDGITLYFIGELGAGKTTLVRALLRALGVTGPVRSPTYTLVEPYELGGRMAFHMDLYRLADPEELEYIGIRELDDAESIRLVEWPERGRGALPAPDLTIEIVFDGHGRRLTLAAHSQPGRRIADSLGESLQSRV